MRAVATCADTGYGDVAGALEIEAERFLAVGLQILKSRKKVIGAAMVYGPGQFVAAR
ncbi:MAG: hypothetical protein AAF671_04885 [Pseudomonadota bacterium]